MRIVVDQDLCTGHARCAAAAPDLFEVDDMGYNRMPPTDVPKGREDEARRGVDACPEYAIRLEETTP